MPFQHMREVKSFFEENIDVCLSANRLSRHSKSACEMESTKQNRKSKLYLAAIAFVVCNL